MKLLFEPSLFPNHSQKICQIDGFFWFRLFQQKWCFFFIFSVKMTLLYLNFLLLLQTRISAETTLFYNMQFIFFLKKINAGIWKSDFSSLSLARRRRRSTLVVDSKSQIPLIFTLKIHFFYFFCSRRMAWMGTDRRRMAWIHTIHAS